MSPEHTDKLIKDFPKLYRNQANPDAPASFYFECGDGWFSILYRLSADIEQAAREVGLTPEYEHWPVATTVKSKWGTLHYYCEAGGYVDDLIDAAEELSAKTCETCGKPGTLVKSGWFTVLCDECRKTKGNNVQKQQHY